MATNEITTKMSERMQVKAANVEVPLRVMTKNPKKVERCKRLAEFNCRKKEELTQEVKAKESEPNLSYGVGAVTAVGVIGLLGYYIHQRGSPGDNKDIKVTPIEVQKLTLSATTF